MSYKNILRNAKSSGATRTLSPTFHEWKAKGQIIVGKFVAASPIKSTLSEGEYNHYLFETDEGLVKFALGGATDKEAGILMISGRVYAIEYKGKEDISSGRRVNKFEVSELLDLDDTPPPGEEKPKK